MSRCLLAASLACILGAGVARAQAPAPAMPAVETPALAVSVKEALPKLETEVARGMALFGAPGLAMGIVHDDSLVYAKGFGVRAKGGAPVDPATVFQIGSTTKAFLSTTLAIAVDKGVLRWDDRVADLDPAFQLMDATTTREFRVFDLTAQRSGLPPYANDILTALGFAEDRLIRSLRYAEPMASFRSTFTYTNITHLAAGRMLAHLRGERDWDAVVAKDILSPLGMTDTSTTAEAIRAAPNHAEGHRWDPQGAVQVPFDPSFPYRLGPAGNLNSSVADMSRWLRLQLADGAFEGKQIVSRDALSHTRIAKVGITPTDAYGQGWALTQTPRGRVIWHNGGTNGFGAHVGFLPDYKVGIVILSNLQNQGLADALAMTAYDLLIGNPPKDHVTTALERAKAGAAKDDARFKRPAEPRSGPDLSALSGTYENDMMGPAHLTAEGDRAVLAFADTGAKLALEPFDGAVFTARLVGEGEFRAVIEMGGDEPLGFLAFEPDADGKLTRLVWLYEPHQTYRFHRK
ncbi:MAG: serine hydrolase [Pseudomonadota bacterium]